MLMLIISTIKEIPDAGKRASSTIVRSTFLLPGIIAAIVLASSGVNIITSDVTTTNTITAVNTSEVFTEAVATSTQIVLQNPIWVTFHFLLAIIMLVYVINQMLILFTKV